MYLLDIELNRSVRNTVHVYVYITDVILFHF